METPNFIYVDTAKSTNSHLAEIAGGLPHGTVLSTDCQTAGRGQRGNTWEAAPGKNITMSVLLHPDGVAPCRQFLLSEAVALAVARTLDAYAGSGICVKWPNDIYYNGLKICGMLIEHSLSGGKIDRTIAGIGVNVNQREFLSDAPNPVSLYQIIGKETPLGEIRRRMAEEILRMCGLLPDNAGGIHAEFLSRLYRRDGYHPYRCTVDTLSVDGTSRLAAGTLFEARIADVAEDGILSLRLPGGAIHRFAFKEVGFVQP